MHPFLYQPQLTNAVSAKTPAATYQHALSLLASVCTLRAKPAPTGAPASHTAAASPCDRAQPKSAGTSTATPLCLQWSSLDLASALPQTPTLKPAATVTSET